MIQQSSKSFLVVQFTKILSDSLSIYSFCASSRNCPAQIVHHKTCIFYIYNLFGEGKNLLPFMFSSQISFFFKSVFVIPLCEMCQLKGCAVVSSEGRGSHSPYQSYGRAQRTTTKSGQTALKRGVKNETPQRPTSECWKQ